MAVYELGALVPLAVQVKDANGTPANVTTMTLTITLPDLTTTSPATTNSPAGTYFLDYSPPQAGHYVARFVGTGTNQSEDTIFFDVLDPTSVEPYASPDTLKTRLGIADTDHTDDDAVYAACYGASRAIDAACERFFSRVTDTRTFDSQGYYRVDLEEFSDLVSVTTLKTDATGDGVFETTWATSDYQLLPQNAPGAPEPEPYTSIKAVGTKLFPIPFMALTRTDLIQITGVYGWPAVPWPIKQAALILAAELFKLKDAPLGVAGFGDLGVVRVKDNPVVAQLIDPYRRHSMLVR